MKITHRFNAWIREDTEYSIWVSWCPDLDLYSQGESLEEALEALRETVCAWVRICHQRKILDRELRNRGWDVEQIEPGRSFVVDGTTQKKYPHSRELEIEVPIPLLAEAYKNNEIGDGHCPS